jgi:hypothetical protein
MNATRCANQSLGWLPPGREIPSGVPRAFRHEAAQRGEPAAKGVLTPRAFCNAPYARVLRARIARFSAGFGKVPAGADVAFFIGSWYQMVTI